MSGLRFTSEAYAELQTRLFAESDVESCAVAYLDYSAGADTWIVCAIAIPSDTVYERRTSDAAVLSAGHVVEIANRARAENYSVAMIHTHPHSAGFPEFSPVDDSGELELAEFFGRRIPRGKHLALVVGRDGCRARVLGQRQEVPVWEVGSSLVLRSAPERIDIDDRHDRQIRAFGEGGQRAVSRLRVGVVGAGGTGSVAIQQLAHLGVNDLTIIDPDYVELTNLNRLAGSIPSDVGSSKVSVARRMFLGINPSAMVETVQRNVVDADVGRRLAEMDFIFLCTDSHASRAVICQAAYQFLVPVVDMGVSITTAEKTITHVTGRVQMLAPGLPCLVCTQALDGEQIRREMLSPEHRVADPYVLGDKPIPQPAVISLNSTMSSLAVTMFLSAVTGAPLAARFQYYDGLRGTVRPTTARRVENCVACSAAGALAKGYRWRLPVRTLRCDDVGPT
ncbi:ThiF family adenylyltransferase [Rhizobium sp. 007]|uniref:HesA/MoeB/ThiF family protein n=1 Tax=Rhizobium sp. 007 TaxID=2785056 RepID=UPI00188F73E0|nr:ThiF family adenylyltransferase [Rhizobium sp. 007]QPB24579.1 ThiF family adenylyltransferase [Rhizobium sp. 007]